MMYHILYYRSWPLFTKEHEKEELNIIHIVTQISILVSEKFL